MPLANKPLNEITEADLQELIDDQVAEGKEYDYKLASWGPTDANKKEFRYDVTSFANTSGGYIIVGMDESGGLPTAIVGLQGDMDQEILRLEGILRAGISPRIQGINMRAVPVQSGNVLIIHIRRSWAAPHMVTFEDNSRFYARHSRGKYLLDVDELRSAFTLSESVRERIRNFRLDRIAKIAADETPIKLSAGAKLVLHLIPVNAFAVNVNLADLSSDKRNKWQSDLSHPIVITTHRYNLDGLLFHGAEINPGSISRGKYLQIFRNGAIEFTDTGLLNRVDTIIPYIEYERTIIALLPIFLEIEKEIGIDAPFIVMLTLLGVNGYTLGQSEKLSDGRTMPISHQKIEQNELLIPDIIIEDFNKDISKHLKAIFDVVWQACGLPQSRNYDKEEKWNPQ